MSNMESRSILVVEDDAPMRGLLRKVLEKNDYHILEAEEGDQALKSLQENPDISLVITDIKMPKKDGMGLLEEIVNSHPHIKVILITAFGEVEQYLDAMNIGAFEYLNKPFRNQQLLDVVKRAIGP
jgi:DNA-binding NtrC family response regulator